jgi:hypothetical protein
MELELMTPNSKVFFFQYIKNILFIGGRGDKGE